MSFTRVFAIFLRQAFLLRRSMGRLFGIFYWTTVELFLWGILTVYLNRIGNAEVNFVTMLLGALIFWDFFLRIQHGVATSFLEDVWSRNFANLFATPLEPGELLAGLVLVGSVQAVLSLAFMSALAALLFAFDITRLGFALLPFIGVLFIFGWAIGIAVNAIVLRFGSAAEVLAWSIPFLFQPLAAVFYPVSALPGWLQTVSRGIPATHVFEGMRAVLAGGPLAVSSLLNGLGLAVVYLAAGAMLFLAAFRAAKKHGYLVHFSTEGF